MDMRVSGVKIHAEKQTPREIRDVSFMEPFKRIDKRKHAEDHHAFSEAVESTKRVSAPNPSTAGIIQYMVNKAVA
ncbi:hypothetical protein NDU88_002766 [Pleurodeles waltl]|uniref:Uncharacterized protein n=1 Tax=Pleurodeles waltl TaxID=8319 RepID=A0AAV7Q7X4_PLEWA|nr:hypothetical protein NDU88_002766 [Pleurodeles waltl]